MIPKILHQIWVGKPMPALFARFAEQWRELHPGWEYRLWTEPELAELEMTNRAVYEAADKLTPNAHNAAQMRSDVARYEILHRHGGVYVDSDEYPLRPIDDLLEGVSFGIGWETDGVWLANGVIAAEPGHTIMLDIITGLPANVAAFTGRGRTLPNVLTGPKFVTPLLVSRPGVTRWPSKVFYPLRWDQLDKLTTRRDYPGSYGVQLWSHSHYRANLALPDIEVLADV